MDNRWNSQSMPLLNNQQLYGGAYNSSPGNNSSNDNRQFVSQRPWAYFMSRVVKAKFLPFSIGRAFHSPLNNSTISIIARFAVMNDLSPEYVISLWCAVSRCNHDPMLLQELHDTIVFYRADENLLNHLYSWYLPVSMWMTLNKKRIISVDKHFV